MGNEFQDFALVCFLGTVYAFRKHFPYFLVGSGQALNTALIVLLEPFAEGGIRYMVCCAEVRQPYPSVALELAD